MLILLPQLFCIWLKYAVTKIKAVLFCLYFFYLINKICLEYYYCFVDHVNYFCPSYGHCILSFVSWSCSSVTVAWRRQQGLQKRCVIFITVVATVGYVSVPGSAILLHADEDGSCQTSKRRGKPHERRRHRERPPSLIVLKIFDSLHVKLFSQIWVYFQARF